MTALWRLQNKGTDIMAMPRVGLVRAIMLNHWYHHRGQLPVCLRLLNQLQQHVARWRFRTPAIPAIPALAKCGMRS
jgi:uncharacterized damage-inducible protein DinB